MLVATDIAARGIDVDELKWVINFDLPNQPETYVHRIGRTGRAGNDGTALSFCDQEEQEYLKDINKLTSQSIPFVKEHPYQLPVRTAPKAEVKKAPKANGQAPTFKKSFNRNKKRTRSAAV